MEKYGLVLEGGGVRGAYTAGALNWLLDHDIHFDYGVGVSSGAVYLVCYWLGDKETGHQMAVEYATDPENVGVSAFLKEGHYVAYEHMFRESFGKKAKIDVTPLRDSHANIEFGLYDLELGRTIYKGSEGLDNTYNLLRASCALPVASAIVELDGHHYLDGGITKMIPIERSVEVGCTKHLIITTKPADYVRKPANNAVKLMMKVIYRDYPSVLEDYKVRHLNYYKQIALISELEEQGNALKIYPSKNMPISRWKGNPKDCEALYQLAYADMDAQKDRILRFMGKSE